MYKLELAEGGLNEIESSILIGMFWFGFGISSVGS